MPPGNAESVTYVVLFDLLLTLSYGAKIYAETWIQAALIILQSFSNVFDFDS